MIGLQELVLILAILLIVFGPKKLPEVARELGRAIQEFKKASANVVDTVSSAWKDVEDEGKTIFSIARNLDIDAEGKSIEQLIEEIDRKIVKNKGNVDIHKNG